MFGRATIRLGIGPHSSYIYIKETNLSIFLICPETYGHECMYSMCVIKTTNILVMLTIRWI